VTVVGKGESETRDCDEVDMTERNRDQTDTQWNISTGAISYSWREWL